jgi:hypothetical protein
MRDREIRHVLHARLAAQHAGDSATRIVDELGLLRGASRIDVAVINGRLEGFEIKSEKDTLERLPHQLEAYRRVFDRLTVICAERHLESALKLAPWWCGVEVAKPGRAKVLHLRRARESRANREVEPDAVAQLLWRDELIDALEELGEAGGLRSKPRAVLRGALVASLPPTRLRALVRDRLRAREGWRVERPPPPDGGGSRP